MKKLLILFLILASFCSYGQIFQDPNTTPSTGRTNDAISGAYPASGTDTYTISPAGLFSYTYLTGKAVSVTFTNPNTGASTMDFDGLGAKNILKWSEGSLVAVEAGDLIGTVRIRYDGTQFVMEGGIGGSSSSGTTRNKLPAVYEVNDFTLLPGDTSRVIIMEDDVTTVTLGDFSTGVDGSQFVLHNSQDAEVTIDPDGQEYLGSLTISDSTFSYIYYNNDTFRISSSGGSGGISALEVGVTEVTSGTGGILYDNTGVLGELASTGTGDVVRETSPTLVTPVLGTVASGSILTNATGLPVGTGISGLGSGVATWLATPSWTNFSSAITGTAPFIATSGTSTLTGAITVASNAANQITFNGTWTAGANNDSHMTFSPSLTSRNTASDNLFAYRFTPTLTVNAGAPASQILTALDIAPTFVGTATKLHMRISGSTGGIGFSDAGQLPFILRPSTTGEVLVGTSSSGSRGFLFSATEFQAGGISTDVPSTAFNTGIRVAAANVTTANQGAVYFFPGAQSPTSGQATGAHFAMSVNSSSGSATIRNVRMQTAGGFTSTATTVSHNLNVRSIPNTMNIGGSFNDIFIDSDITQNASSSVPWAAINIAPTINQTSSGAGTKRALWYHPTETALLGVHYFIVNESTTALSGLATSTPLSTLDVDGSFANDITSTSTDITLGVTHCTILVDASGAARTITLPTAASSSRRIYTIKKTDSSGNAVTVDGDASETIDGATTQPINTQWEYLRIQSNGTAWFIIGND